MELDFLSKKILIAISNCDESKIFDIRLRLDCPIKLNYNNQIKYLTSFGVDNQDNCKVICEQKDIDYILSYITENSIYAFNNQIKNGYITTKNGVRIGLSGTCVVDDNKILTIKNITSLNIRIPHEIKDCSSMIYNKIFLNEIFNCLIVSPPERGKTTILKDLIIKINNNYNQSILIIDERGEFQRIKGENIDSIVNSNKGYAFNYGLRSMSPNIVFTDELCNESDWICAKNAKNSGVKIIASCHSDCVNELREKNFFIKNVFDRYVFLKNKGEIGKIDGIYDGNFNLI